MIVCAAEVKTAPGVFEYSGRIDINGGESDRNAKMTSLRPEH
jgi:hypothetical protein